MPRWRLFYHIIWTTDQREPAITPRIESKLYRVIAQKAVEMKTSVLAIGGMPDHIHIVAAIPPTVVPLHVIEMLKEASADFIEQRFGIILEWQQGFGIVTISKRNLQRAIEYVHNQKNAHQTHSTIPSLETTLDEDEDDEDIEPDFDLDLHD